MLGEDQNNFFKNNVIKHGQHIKGSEFPSLLCPYETPSSVWLACGDGEVLKQAAIWGWQPCPWKGFEAGWALRS